jgi:hypothetical protein
MKKIIKTSIVGLTALIVSTMALAQGSQLFVPRGKGAAPVISSPSSVTVNNHSYANFDVSVSDSDDFWMYNG